MSMTTPPSSPNIMMNNGRQSMTKGAGQTHVTTSSATSPLIRSGCRWLTKLSTRKCLLQLWDPLRQILRVLLGLSTCFDNVSPLQLERADIRMPALCLQCGCNPTSDGGGRDRGAQARALPSMRQHEREVRLLVGLPELWP